MCVFSVAQVVAHLSFADALLGFLFISLFSGTITSLAVALYIPFLKPSRNECFTIRSSPLWKLIIAILPPGFRQ